MRDVCFAIAACLAGMAAACDSTPEAPTTPAPAVPPRVPRGMAQVAKDAGL